MAQLKDNSTMGGDLLAKDAEKADDPHNNTAHSEDFVNGEDKAYTIVYGDTPSGTGYINFIPE